MKQIAFNQYYELSYDEENNWIYWKIKGFWKDMSVVPNFEADWQKAVDAAQKPFRIYGDLSQSKTMPDAVKKANDEMQQYLLKNGCNKVACIVDSALTKMTINNVLRESNMITVTQFFTSAEAKNAKKWLKG